MAKHPWHIHSINNATGKCTVIDQFGKKLDVNIPDTHESPDARNAFIHGHLERNKQTHTKYRLIFFSIITLELLQLGLIAWLLLRQ